MKNCCEISEQQRPPMNTKKSWLSKKKFTQNSLEYFFSVYLKLSTSHFQFHKSFKFCVQLGCWFEFLSLNFKQLEKVSQWRAAGEKSFCEWNENNFLLSTTTFFYNSQALHSNSCSCINKNENVFRVGKQTDKKITRRSFQIAKIYE